MEEYRVALVSDWYYPKVGGVEYSIDALARNLRALGHSVQIITRRYPRAPEYNPGEESYVKRVKGVPVWKQGRVLSPGAYKELYRMLKAGNYSIIHAHSLDSPLCLFSLVASRRLGIPAVVTNHSLIGQTPLRRLLLLAGKFFLRNADAVIAVSSAVERECRLMTKKPVYLIPHGIEAESGGFRENPLPFNGEGKIVITTVARMTGKKRVKDIVEVAPMLLKKHRNIMFLMVGGGPFKEKLEKKVKNLNLNKNFHFTGEVPRKTVLSLLEHSSIFVLPSKDEAFGISILEALSQRVPIVARNHSGVSDIIEHRKTGLLAEDKHEIARYVEELIERPELGEYLSSAAINELYKYNWRDIAKRVEEVYSGVVYGNFSHS